MSPRSKIVLAAALLAAATVGLALLAIFNMSWTMDTNTDPEWATTLFFFTAPASFAIIISAFAGLPFPLAIVFGFVVQCAAWLLLLALIFRSAWKVRSRPVPPWSDQLG